MINSSFSEKQARHYLYPVGQVQPVPDLRIGITSIREKWARAELKTTVNIPANLLPSEELINSINSNQYEAEFERAQIRYVWELNQHNDRSIRADFDFISNIQGSAPIP